ncbi:TPA: hypothetical protein HA281_05650 [Candidatus Woesearchaeota archaeon]|nr:MAG: hypothetical protein QT04_C0055G0012 [archaeon GW2011_AR11]MBS3110777.1 hypothetical protein [Candidatus Woesearchaeota archaeon]HIH04722.1 hypothetical protein [Candidatus Woesearchaeota archaeon]HIH92257.1 hypothetical protein [Candidatus Woesearchaeota archaeon]HII64346.1 hypothetical protein [Candidatus Woesearchaeota archaeon]
MPIVGFGLTKIIAEKNAAIKGKVDIRNNVGVKDVRLADISLGKDKGNAAKFIFEFTSTYEPGIGRILFEGEVLFMDDPGKIKELQESWKKDSKLPQDVMAPVLNSILNKCNVQALILSQDINLPPPIPLPKVQMSRPAAASPVPAKEEKKEQKKK